MIRKFISFPVADSQLTKLQMLNWCNRFNICCFLDNHNYRLPHHSIECLAAAGSLFNISCNAGTALKQLYHFSKDHQDWIFGHFGYDLKNEIEDLGSAHPDFIGFPDLFFFVPKVVLQLSEGKLNIGSVNDDHSNIWDEISNQTTLYQNNLPGIDHISARFSQNDYVEAVHQLQKHILRGDCYEINFCQEFYATGAIIDPLQIYHVLSSSSPNPFSAFYKNEHLFVACLSPERYIKKTGNRILSQPIKGTARRVAADKSSDLGNAKELANSEKERAENIMIVDLVRNDLSRVCVQGSVEVEELCTVYSFPNVHQLVSTVAGVPLPHIPWTDIIRATFPMGSMTGAPKKRVMELIEQYERTRRGIFSGSIGYYTPEGDFDFNVVIRSLMYNETSRYLSMQSGSAITFSSDAEREYDECLLKVAAIKKALAETNTFH